jgi:hypothetical protein
MRFLILPALLLPFVGFVAADVVRPADADERLRQLQRDLPLIQSLVQSSLELASADDPTRRARLCTTLAEGFSGEMRRAVADNDRGRASLLGAQLQVVWERGVAVNLNSAFRRLPADAPVPLELRLIGEQVDKMAGSLQAEVDKAPAAEQDYMRAALEAVNKGQLEVQSTIKNKGRSKLILRDGQSSRD